MLARYRALQEAFEFRNSEFPPSLLANVTPTSLQDLDVPQLKPPEVFNHSSSSPPGGFEIGRIPYRFQLENKEETDWYQLVVTSNLR